MIFELERTTPFAVNAKEVINLLQDPERFMMAGGGSLEGSIRYDENESLWHGEYSLFFALSRHEPLIFDIL